MILVHQTECPVRKFTISHILQDNKPINYDRAQKYSLLHKIHSFQQKIKHCITDIWCFWTITLFRPNQLLPDRKKIVIFLIFHCWWLACIVSFTCIKPFSLLLILIRVVFLFHIPMSYETNKEKNGNELYSVICSIELFIILLCRLLNRAEI
jgi:hypothetical protein